MKATDVLEVPTPTLKDPASVRSANRRSATAASNTDLEKVQLVASSRDAAKTQTRTTKKPIRGWVLLMIEEENPETPVTS